MIIHRFPRGLRGEDDGAGVAPVYHDPQPGDEYYEDKVQRTLARIDGILPDDDLYAQGVMAFAASEASYWGPAIAADSRIRAALARLRTRYDFVTTHFPGASVLPAGAQMPGGSGGRAPIVIAYPDGTFGYAPGYGPTATYGAYQTADAARPPDTRVSAYTGLPVGSVNRTDVTPPVTDTARSSSPAATDAHTTGAMPAPGGLITDPSVNGSNQTLIIGGAIAVVLALILTSR